MQLPEGAQWYRVNGTAAGTTTIKADKTALYSVVIGGNYTGTVTIYDSASGTTPSLLVALNNNSGSVPVSIDFGARLRHGLTVVKGGTTEMLLMYQ